MGAYFHIRPRKVLPLSGCVSRYLRKEGEPKGRKRKEEISGEMDFAVAGELFYKFFVSARSVGPQRRAGEKKTLVDVGERAKKRKRSFPV